MPRSRPGALRGALLGPLWSDRTPEPVRGLSSATSLAIFRVELALGDYHVYIGSTRRALVGYREFTSRRGPLYPMPVECECSGCPFDSVVHARDVLEHVLERLPVRAKAELGRVVRRLDAEFLRRTLPDPSGRRPFWNRIDHSPDQPEPWWYGRLPGPPWSEVRRQDAPTGSRRRRR
ncbi:hypothetical protein [Lentzea indica]|uniref:hypothetical protein n=1 Tax=Lentzea indica TaxID=2604800 RepID=UPI00165ED4C6|nr:hypothetical protein [Lentzea indica]